MALNPSTETSILELAQQFGVKVNTLEVLSDKDGVVAVVVNER